MIRTKPLVITACLLLLLFVGWCSLRSSSLEIEAQVIYSIGGPQPVARESFYLLDTDIRQLPDLHKAYSDVYKRGDLGGGMFSTTPRRTALDFLMAEGEPLWRPHVTKSVRTDFQGRAMFENIKPGDYWVFGFTETRGERRMIWYVRVTVGRGTNKLLLSNDNRGLDWPAPQL